jgi:hypothetical protein
MDRKQRNRGGKKEIQKRKETMKQKFDTLIKPTIHTVFPVTYRLNYRNN